MKLFTRILFLMAFCLPYSIVSAADIPDDATMDVIEHSNSERYEHEIELPDTAASEAHDMNHEGKEYSPEVESPEIESPEAPEVESPEIEAPEKPEAPETH